MINRTILANGNTQFQDFANSSACCKVGDFVELPMTFAGSVMGRFEIISAIKQNEMMVFEAVRAA